MNVRLGRYDASRARFSRASRSLARGVSSAMKAGQEPVPICAARGAGSRIWDIDGNEYVDCALSFGPMLLGQSPPDVLKAAHDQLDVGVGFGAGNRHEAPLAEMLCEVVPSAELVIFSNTGTEAVQVALRVARAATGRNRVIKFDGHYHGWLDSMHVAIPGVPERRVGTAGQDPSAIHNTTVCEWNDASALADALSDDVAAVIMEPINVNGGCFAPAEGYLHEVRRLTTAAGALLIFDEVITGFRVALGGAQELLGVVPDLTVLGKALGSGFAISAVCGSEAVMSVVADGRVAHMGNFNGNPVAAAASRAAISYLSDHRREIYPRLESLMTGIADAFDLARTQHGLRIQFNRTIGAGFAFMANQPVRNHQDRLRSDSAAYGGFAAQMLDEGVLIATRGLWYVSTEHSDDDIARVSDAIVRVAAAMADKADQVPAA